MDSDVPNMVDLNDESATTSPPFPIAEVKNSNKPRGIGSESENLSLSQTSPDSFSQGPSRTGLNEYSTNLPVRRFKPDLIETSQWHGGRSVDSYTNDASAPSKQESRRFTPQLIETTRKVCRKFEPQLVETARRSRRKGDTQPAITSADRTDVDPCSETVIRRRRIPRELAFVSTTPTDFLPSSSFSKKEARKRGISLPRRSLSASSALYYHYKSPELDTIESSESERSSPPSPSSSQSRSPFPSSSRLASKRESVNSRTPGRLLAVAAANAERQLKERALAAFPNQDTRPSVQHYVDLDHTPNISSYSTMYEIETMRNHSTNWELKEIIHHHEKLEAEREEEQRKREARRKLHQHLDKNPFAMPVSFKNTDCKPKREQLVTNQHEDEVKKVRPPMLGKDIEFPRSQSPDPARFDVTQGPESLKRSMCYLSQQCEPTPPPSGGLWSSKRSVGHSTSQWSRPTSRAPSNGGGLWGGSCVDTGPPQSRRPSGLVTPLFEGEQSYFSKDATSLLKSHLPPSPPASNSGKTTAEETEMSIEVEFDDHFVTQVYNYMSLGYPAIARDFDEELGKVTRASLEQLRQDDHLPNARGYIRLGEDAELAAGVTEENCARWKALRLYIHEWARQQPKMAKPKEIEPGWVAARKGSWGW